MRVPFSVQEETGISLDAVIDTGFFRRYPIRAEWREWYGEEPEAVEEHVFYALTNASVEPILSSEHSAWRWCSEAEAHGLLTFGSNAECLQAVARSLSPEA